MPSVSCTSSCVAASAIQVTATLDVSAGNQSIADNYTTINYSYRAVRNNYGFIGTTRDNVGTLQVLINGSVVKSVAVGLTYDSDGGNTECSGSGSVNVGHNADGTKSCSYQVKIVGGSDPRGANYQWNSSASSAPSMTLTTIPRATRPSMSASSATMGNAITINTPRASSAFTHSLWYQVNGGNWHDIASGVGTSYSWTVPIELASSVPNGTSISVTVICRTYNGSTNLGDKYTSFTAYVPSSVVPSMGNPTATRVDNGVPSGWGVYVKGYSKVTIAMTSVSGSYGSTIKSYSITGPNLSSTSSSATSGVLGSAGTNTYTCTITDSRGRSVSKTVSISVVDYAKPSISVSASRCNSDGTVSSSGTYVSFTAYSTYASVSGKNGTLGLASCNGVSTNDFYSGVTKILAANCAINTSYTLTVSVTDTLGSSASASVTIPTASRIMNVRANKTGVAFGKFAEMDDYFDVGWRSVFRQSLSVDGSLYTRGFLTHDNMSSNGNSAAYMRIATLTVTSSYVNGPIEIRYYQRGSIAATSLYVMFQSTDSTDPSVDSFRFEGWCLGAYIAKTATSTWDIFIKKSESWEKLGIQYWAHYGFGVGITYRGDNYTSLPSGYITATPIYTEGNGIYGFADGGKYLEIRTAAHGTKGINWWDSDASLKKNIKNTEVRYALEKISRLKHVEFDWKENDSHVDLGYVADDVEKVLPCLVFEVAQYGEDGKPNGESIKNIDHRTMIPLITMGMQELIEERDLLWTFDEEAANCIIKLREEVDSLKSTVNELKAEIESLKKAISV